MKKGYKDLTGRIFGRLEVKGFKEWYTFSSGQRRSVWECICTCGKTTHVMGGNLTSGHTMSCGCFSNESRITRQISHGMSKTPEYCSYIGMICRCFDSKIKSFENYGGRGITVCDRWLEAEDGGLLNFITDMGERPEGMTLDRIDVNGNYEPSNCRWATDGVQTFNQRVRRDNKSGVTGVHWHKKLEKWEAAIQKEGRKHILGYFHDYEVAVSHRRQAEIMFYGEPQIKTNKYEEF